MTGTEFYMSKEVSRIDDLFKKKKSPTRKEKYPLIGLSFSKKTGSSKFFSNLGASKMDTCKYKRDNF